MRLGYVTTLAAAMGLLALFAVACSSEDPTATPVPTVAPTQTPVPTNTAVPEAAAVLPSSGLEEPEQEWTTRTESEELRLILATPDLAPGTRRFAMVLTDGSGIVAFPVFQVSSYRYPDGSDAVSGREGPVEMALARYFEFPYGTRGIHVTELTFDEDGMWGVEASVPQPDGSVATIEVLMEVHEETMSVDLGEVPPLAASRTLADVEDVSDLTTGSQRDESLYQVSLGDAIQNGKPTVVVFASPAFCTNAVCGPQVEVLSNLSATYGDAADFVHVDLFTNPKEIQGDLTRAMKTPLLEEWGLVSQEWTFVMDRDGVVVGRFENFVPQLELEPSLESVLAAAEVKEPGESMMEAGEVNEFDVSISTTWHDLFDQFEDSEQSCIRDGFSEEELETILARQVLSEEESVGWQETFIDCVDPATARAVWLGNMLASMEGLSEGGEDCIRELVAGADVKAVIAGEQPDASPEEVAVTGVFYGGLFTCGLLGMVEQMGDLEGDEACLADVLTTVDPATIYAGSREDASPRDAAKFETFMLSMFQCVPGLLEFAFDEAAGAPMPTQ
ncbi:MAG: hypothetical protein F4180_06430 [Chloroflexi bacterium]|nr:hypothetical protein [Chloroflexota bacterium]